MSERMIAEAFGPRTLMGLGYGWTGSAMTPAGRMAVPFTGSGERAKCEYPWYCYSWLGQALFDECNPFTEAELRACQAADFGPAMTAPAQQQAITAGDQSVAAYLAMHPDEAEAYRQALEDPNHDLKMIGWIAAGIGVFVLILAVRR